MKIFKWKYGEKLTNFKNTACALGNFDGCHLGHQSIIKSLLGYSRENDKKSIIITFYPHPMKITAAEMAPPLIQTLEQRLKTLKEFEIDFCLLVNFDKRFACISAENFINSFLLKDLGVKVIFAGYDVRFGHNREGNAEFLKKIEKKEGLQVFFVEPVKVNNIIVSSSKIRRALSSGEIELANSMLGREWGIFGKVRKGKGRGERIGFPTINIEAENEIIPLLGVYAGKLKYRENTYKSVIHIGPRPTFNEETISIEAHIIDFNKNILNEKIELFFVQRIRDIIKFQSVDELTEQIKKDVKICRKM